MQHLQNLYRQIHFFQSSSGIGIRMLSGQPFCSSPAVSKCMPAAYWSKHLFPGQIPNVQIYSSSNDAFLQSFFFIFRITRETLSILFWHDYYSYWTSIHNNNSDDIWSEETLSWRFLVWPFPSIAYCCVYLLCFFRPSAFLFYKGFSQSPFLRIFMNTSSFIIFTSRFLEIFSNDPQHHVLKPLNKPSISSLLCSIETHA